MCGRIEGYQFGAAGAFYRGVKGIDSYYVDGVSLTHGGAGRRQHIWTFATGGTEVNQGSNPAELIVLSVIFNSVSSMIEVKHKTEFAWK